MEVIIYNILYVQQENKAKKKQHGKKFLWCWYNTILLIYYHYHTQLLDTEKLLNLNERSPAVSLSSCIGWEPSPASDPSWGNGCIWFSFGWRANWTSGGNGNGNTEGDKLLNLVLSTLEANVLSQRKTWRRIGTLVCLCKDSFWLNETVS